MKLRNLGTTIKLIGIIYLFILVIKGTVHIPLPLIVILTVGYLFSAISCDVPLLSISFEHHKIFNYFVGLLGIIAIVNNIIHKS
jgi:hypothetical protein